MSFLPLKSPDISVYEVPEDPDVFYEDRINNGFDFDDGINIWVNGVKIFTLTTDTIYSLTASNLTLVNVTTDNSPEVNTWVRVDATSHDVEITLPDPTESLGRLVKVSRVDASSHDVTVVSVSGLVEGDSAVLINTQNTSLVFRSNGSGWEIE